MSIKQKLKLEWLINHRRMMYQLAMQKYIDGKVPYSYVEERWQKLKEVDK